jgi:hypothetical protein
MLECCTWHAKPATSEKFAFALYYTLPLFRDFFTTR